MLAYEPGRSLAHRLDPRAKLAFQAGFAVAAFAHTTPTGLAACSAVVAGALAAARLSPLAALGEFRAFVPFLLLAPLVEGLTLGSPWFVPADAVAPALASYRGLLLLALGAAYVKTTPVRDSEAAVQWLVPGRAGRLLGVGVGFVFRFLPVLQADLTRVREAAAARLGTERAAPERMRLVAVAGLSRAFARADRFALALRARCFAWNATLPTLAFARRDAGALVAAAALVLSAVV